MPKLSDLEKSLSQMWKGTCSSRPMPTTCATQRPCIPVPECGEDFAPSRVLLWGGLCELCLDRGAVHRRPRGVDASTWGWMEFGMFTHPGTFTTGITLLLVLMLLTD